MNTYLKQFVENTFDKPGRSLDIGGTKLDNADGLQKMGWEVEVISRKHGMNLDEIYEADPKVDLVFSCYTFQFISNKAALVRSAHKSLQEDGWFFLHTYDENDPHITNAVSTERIRQLYDGLFDIHSERAISYYDSRPEHQHDHFILEVIAQKT